VLFVALGKGEKARILARMVSHSPQSAHGPPAHTKLYFQTSTVKDNV